MISLLNAVVHRTHKSNGLEVQDRNEVGFFPITDPVFVSQFFILDSKSVTNDSWPYPTKIVQPDS